MANISAIKLPNNTTYTLVDNTSGYTKNTGTITQVKTTAGTHSVINVTSGAANFNVPTKTSHLTNDSGFITSVPVTSVNTKTGAVSLTYSDVNAAAASHKHGYINSDGTLTSTSYIGNGDSIVIIDSSDSGKIANTYITFDGSTTTTALTPKGTWETFLKSYTETDPIFTASAAHGISSSDITNWNSKTSNTGTVTSVGLTNATNGGLTISGSPITESGSITVGHSNVLTSAQTTQAVYPIKIDKNGHISAYGTAVTIPTVPTNVSAFTNDAGYITSYTETDPIFTSSVAYGISSSDITNWNGKQAALVSGTNIKTINNTSLLGSGNITIEDASDIKLYYESGDSITYGEYESGLVITGFVTSSKKEDHYTIPLAKPCTASTVTITNFGLICRQNNNYVHGTGATTYKTPSYTATLTGQDSDGAYTSIKVVCTWSNTTNVVNNAPIAANIRGVFTFS